MKFRLRESESNLPPTRLGSYCPYVAEVLHFWPDLPIAKVDDNKWCPLLTGVYGEAKSLPPSLAMYSIYECHFKLGLSLSPNRALISRGLHEGTSVHCDCG